MPSSTLSSYARALRGSTLVTPPMQTAAATRTTVMELPRGSQTLACIDRFILGGQRRM
uniref:Uncharacterized protein n=1 Tax=Musa acuminata subsp. malaccensis TaxID=214687 RepID=A0A804HNH6_MUSAM